MIKKKRKKKVRGRGNFSVSTEMIMSLPMQLGMIALCGEVEQANKFAQVAADILYPAFLGQPQIEPHWIV